MPEFADWMRAVAIVGKHGDEYKIILVDDLGNLYALLQGETIDEELRTVRLDDQGRLSAFVIDSVDAWGQMLSVGNAEGAARLGSPVAYEQSGRVQLVETFENGLQRWLTGGSGDGNSVAISPVAAHSGGYSCKLTSGSDDERTAYIQFEQGSLPTGRVGIAFAFSSPTEYLTLEWFLNLYDGATLYRVRGRFTDATDDLEIRDDADAWQVIGTGKSASELTQSFFFVKVVADLETATYDVFRFNQQNIDISAHALKTEDCAEPARVAIEIRVTSGAGDNDIVYVDNVIYTVAEPE